MFFRNHLWAKIDEKNTAWEGCQKSGEKSVGRVLNLIAANLRIAFMEMISALQTTRSTIQKHIANLKAANRICRIGSDKDGHWKVV